MRRKTPPTAMSKMLPGIAVAILFSLLFTACSAWSEASLTQVRGQAASLLSLRTYRAYYHEILYFEDKQTVLGIFSTRDRKFLFGMDFVLTAGPKLGDAFKVSRRADGTLVFTLPYPEILAVDGREESIQQYINQTYGGDLTYLEIGDLLEAARNSIAADAASRGILQKAALETERLLDLLAAQLGWEQVAFEWEAPNAES